MAIDPLLLKIYQGASAQSGQAFEARGGNGATGSNLPAVTQSGGAVTFGLGGGGFSTAKSFLFVSTYGGEGTTYSCVRSARNLSRNLGDAQILLVDMNLKHPALSERLGDPKDGWLPAMSDIAGADIGSACLPLVDENLWILPIGAGKRDIGLLELAAAFPVLMSRLKQEFGLVIVDGPPVLDSTHSLLLCQHVDGMVLVIEAGKTRRQVVNVAMEQIARAGGNVIGAVMNKRQYFIPSWIYDRLFAVRPIARR